jgi:hypothetical protein
VKVFVSSVVGGMEGYRDAAVRAARALGHEVRRSEDFPALDASPEQACLAGVRWADVVVLLLGPRYGRRLGSGLSATHEEYREARERRPVLAFVRDGVEREPDQEAFVDEVRRWQGGRVTAGFSIPDDLRDALTRALHEFEMSKRAGEVDEAEMLARAQALLPDAREFGTPSLSLVVVGGPRQPVLRPSELEDPELDRDLLKEALLGENAVFSPAKGTSSSVSEGALVLGQPDSSIRIDDLGSVRIIRPAVEERTGLDSGLSVLIDAVVRDRLQQAIRLSGWVLDRIDSTHRLTYVLPVLSLNHAAHVVWKTREEHAGSPSSMTVPRVSDPEVVTLSPPTRSRAALLHDTDRLVEDFVSVLGQRFRT